MNIELLRQLRQDKIGELRVMNANIVAVINEYEPKIAQAEAQIEELTELIGDEEEPE